jgi:hypothetical protein
VTHAAQRRLDPPATAALPTYLRRWQERRHLGRNAYVRWFLLRRWLWHSALSACIYAYATFWFSSRVLGEEPDTTAWFGLKLGSSTFGIFDAFPNDAGRQAHLSGKVAAALMANASALLAQPPSIEKIDVLAAKLP